MDTTTPWDTIHLSTLSVLQVKSWLCIALAAEKNLLYIGVHLMIATTTTVNCSSAKQLQNSSQRVWQASSPDVKSSLGFLKLGHQPCESSASVRAYCVGNNLCLPFSSPADLSCNSSITLMGNMQVCRSIVLLFEFNGASYSLPKQGSYQMAASAIFHGVQGCLWTIYTSPFAQTRVIPWFDGINPHVTNLLYMIMCHGHQGTEGIIQSKHKVKCIQFP